MLNVEKTYVIHYTKLLERRNFIENFFLENNYKNYQFIEKYDREELTEEVLNNFYNPSPEQYDKTIKKTYLDKCVPFRNLRPAELSCTIKHFEAMKKITNETKEFALIVEDDIIPINNFANNFNNYLEKTPKDWDVIFMGNCCSLRISAHGNNNGKVAFLKEHPASKCTDSFLIKKHLAEKITNRQEKFSTIIDWELSYLFHKFNAKVYWWEPHLVLQGSELGTYKSSLR